MMKAEELKNLREQAGLSRSEAARLIGVADRTWQRWENGEKTLPDGVTELFQRRLRERYDAT